MRYRVRSDQTFSGTKVIKVDNTLTTSCADQSVIYVSGRDYEAMLDVEVPDFHRRKAKGEVFFNYMAKEQYTAQCNPATWSARWRWDNSLLERNNICLGTGYFPPIDIPVLLQTTDPKVGLDSFLETYNSERGIAVAKAWSNVDESELLAYATIGELPETMKWLTSLYRRFIKLLLVFKTKKSKLLKDPKRQRKSGGNNPDVKSGSNEPDLLDMWMEIRYAVRPLMFEMEQLITALRKQKSPPRQTARGFHEVTETIRHNDVLTFQNAYRVTRQGVTKRESDYRAGVLYSIDLATPDFITTFGLDHPLEAVWELTRLSFALDWFINVGDVLSAHTWSANLTPLGSFVKETHLYTTDVSFSNVHRDTAALWAIVSNVSTPGTLRATHRIVRRISSPHIPMFPSVKIKLDWAKIVDLAAIARSIYRAFRKDPFPIAPSTPMPRRHYVRQHNYLTRRPR